MNYGKYESIERIVKKNCFFGLKIFIIGNHEEIINIYESIFISKIIDKDFIKRAEKEFKTDQIYWIAKFYKDLTKENISSIINEIVSDRNEKLLPKIFQHVIIFYDNNKQNYFNLFIDDIKEKGSFYIPSFIIISNTRYELMIKDLRSKKIIHIIMDGMNKQEIKMEIISALRECDCYYNERGNEVCMYIPLNFLANNLSFFTINILLTGKYRSGKSTFINSLSNKKIALEALTKAPISKKITEYFIYNPDGNRKNNFLKLIDTPGFTSDREFNEGQRKSLKELLENKTKKIENEIHFIFFFFMEGSSLEGYDDIFILLDNCNKPVFFIISKAIGEVDEDGQSKDIGSTINLLKKKNLNNLTNKNNYFGINIVKSKRIKIFGIEKIFQRMYKMYEEQNIFTQKEITNNVWNKFNSIKNNEIERKNTVLLFQKTLSQKIDIFKGQNLENIILEKEIYIKNFLEIICNLVDKPSIEDEPLNIPILQTLIIIYIAEIFGLNFFGNELTKDYLSKIENFLKNEYIIDPYILNMRENIVQECKEIDFLVFLSVAILLMIIRKVYYQKYIINGKNFDKIITYKIGNFCLNYLKDKNFNSYGLFFITGYLNKFKMNIKDLKNFYENNLEPYAEIEIKTKSFNDFIQKIKEKLKQFKQNALKPWLYFIKNKKSSKLNKYFNE